MPNETIDTLELRVESDSSKAIQNLEKMQKLLGDIGQALSGIKTGNLGNLGNLTEGVKSATKSVSDLAKNAKDIVVKPQVDLKQLDKGKSQIDGIKKSAESAQKSMAKSFEIKIDRGGATRDLEYFKKDLEDAKKAVEWAISGGGNGDNSVIFENLENSINELKTNFPQATGLIRAFEEEWKKLDSIQGMSGVSNSVKKTKTDVESLIVGLQAKFQSLGKDFKFTGTGEELKKAIDETSQKLDALFAKEKELIAGGQTDTTAFVSLQRQIAETSNKFDALNKKQEEYEAFQKRLSGLSIPPINETNVKKLESTLSRAEANLDKFKAKLSNDIKMGRVTASIDDSGYRKAQEQISLTQRTVEALRNRIADLNARSRDTSALGAFKNALTSISSAGKDARKGLSGIASAFSKLTSGISSAASKIRSFGKSVTGMNSANAKSDVSFKKALNTVLKYGFGIRSLYFAFRRLRSAIAEGFKNLSQYSTQMNSTVSSLSSSLTVLKNALAVAFAPIVTAVAPYIQAFLNMLISALNLVGRFMAALTGKGMAVQAKKITQNYAGSISGVGDSAKGAAKDVKKLNKELSVLAFDELNQLSKPSETGGAGGGGGGAGAGGGGGLTGADMFETVPVESKLKNLADSIKDVFAGIFKPFQEAWQIEGEGTIKAAQYALSSVGELAKSVGQSLYDVWTNGTGAETLTTILQIAQNVLNTIGNLASRFTEAWNEAGLGTSIIQGIFDILNVVLGTIERMTGATAKWAEKLNFTPLLKSIDALLKAIEPLTQNIGDGLAWFYENVLLPVAGWAIQDAVPTFLNMVSAAIDALNAVIEALKPLGQWLWEEFIQPLGNWTGDLIISAMETLTDLLEGFGDWVSEHQAIVEGFAVVVGSFALVFQAASAAVAIWNGIATIAEAVTTAFGAAFSFLTSPIGIAVIAIGAIVAAGVLLYKNWDTIKKKAKEIWDGVSSKIEDAKKAISEKWDDLKKKTSETWDNIKTAVSNKAKDLKDDASKKFQETKDSAAQKFEEIKTAVTDKLDTAKNKAQEKFESIKTAATEKLDTAKTTAQAKFEDIRKSASEKLDAAKTSAQTAFESIKTAATDKLDTAKSKAQAAFEGIADSAQTKMKDAWKWVKDKIDDIKDIFDRLSLKLPKIDIPKIKLPHFSIKGEFSLMPPKVPTLSVSWYAKGGLFNQPSLIGVGEAGKEAVLPLENKKTMAMIADSITQSGGLGLDEDTMANAVARGVAMAMMNNSGNQAPINVYATLYTENDEVLARAVTRGQRSLDYRNNPVPQFG